MAYKTYRECRETFAKNKLSLSNETLLELIKSLEKLAESAIFKNEKDEIEDLVFDIEIEQERRITPIALAPSEIESSYVNFSAIAPSDVVCITLFNEKTKSLMYEVECEAIRISLCLTEGNRTQAAKMLGLSIRTLRNKINLMHESKRIRSYDISRLC